MKEGLLAQQLLLLESVCALGLAFLPVLLNNRSRNGEEESERASPADRPRSARVEPYHMQEQVRM